MLDRAAFHHALTRAAQAQGLPLTETPDGWTLALPGGAATIPLDAPYAAYRRGLALEALAAALAEAATAFQAPAGDWHRALTLHLTRPDPVCVQQLVAPGLALTLALDRPHGFQFLTAATLAAWGTDPAAAWARAEAQWPARLPAPERIGPLALWTGPYAADAAWHYATRQPDGWVAVPWVEAAGWAPPEAWALLAHALRWADAAGLGHHPLAPGRLLRVHAGLALGQRPLPREEAAP
jgi:hypothetical protein